MEGGVSYASVQAAISLSANIVSDPPVALVTLRRVLRGLARPTL
jgi:hypothetical protein